MTIEIKKMEIHDNYVNIWFWNSNTMETELKSFYWKLSQVDLELNIENVKISRNL